MDPAARRSLWKVILHLVRSCSLSVILTSHSMEECEYLCSRLAIMVNGRFQCLGAPQHLKNRFGKGFTLIAKLEYDKNNEVKQAFHHFIKRTFPNSILKDEHQTMVSDIEFLEKWQKCKKKCPVNSGIFSVTQIYSEFLFRSIRKKLYLLICAL